MQEMPRHGHPHQNDGHLCIAVGRSITSDQQIQDEIRYAVAQHPEQEGFEDQCRYLRGLFRLFVMLH